MPSAYNRRVATADAALEHLRRADPVLAALIERVGPFAMSYRPPTFETLARAIVFQQLNGKAAATISSGRASGRRCQRGSRVEE